MYFNCRFSVAYMVEMRRNSHGVTHQLTAGHSRTMDNNLVVPLQRISPNTLHHMALAQQYFRYLH